MVEPLAPQFYLGVVLRGRIHLQPMVHRWLNQMKFADEVRCGATN
jgi:hypothetical protein